MNPKKNLIISLFLLLIITATNGLAVPFKLLHCHIPSVKKQKNIQCIYSVYGQKIKKPKSFSKLYVNTNMPYALCASALCDIDPNKPKTSICTCPVKGVGNRIEAWKRLSVAPLFYEIIHPKYKGKTLLTVPSTFSLVNTTRSSTVKMMACHFNEPTPWANCFGARCKIHYQDQGGKTVPIATCRCRIVKTPIFATTGPKNREACKTINNKVWSAATVRQAENEVSVIKDAYRRFYPKSPPINH